MTREDIPSITTDQMREVDRLMIEVYGISLIQMMENAGRALARLASRHFFGGDPRNGRVAVLVGPGGNGGGGLVCARNLHNWGANVHAYVGAPVEQMGEVPRQQLSILETLGVPVTMVTTAADLHEADLVVDALIGYSLSGAPRGTIASLIRAAQDLGSPVLSLDAPSGVDATTGQVFDPAIRADVTLTLALPKTGLVMESAEANVGELYLADIGVPPGLYARPTLELDVGPIFAESELVRLG
ncbi:MAG: NAD(P)H-hydrate epimerase [Dehalococcoidia bacterium]